MENRKGRTKAILAVCYRLAVRITIILFAGVCFPLWAADVSGGQNDKSPSLREVKGPENKDIIKDDQVISYESSLEDIKEQKRILDSARQALDLRLRALHDSIDSSVDEGSDDKAIDQEAITRLVNIYENMSPREAAAVFDVMDPHVLVVISSRMNTRKLSAIMAQMSRERVNMVSQYLIGVRQFHKNPSFMVSTLGGDFPDKVLPDPDGKSYVSDRKPKSHTKALLPSRQ
ncbi:hypothetical protein PT277_10215 [Acetobacteraceae bacterium ESL0709]|nr:hypothetical protein [Acetobacteraceae bacterium ESL0697]MDF7679055.1 hypothetical protein [Acetobacteraceae bacterium ESL0709]